MISHWLQVEQKILRMKCTLFYKSLCATDLARIVETRFQSKVNAEHYQLWAAEVSIFVAPMAKKEPQLQILHMGHL